MSIFSKIPVPRLKSSSFNLSEEMKMSCNFGDLIPILCKETLPNDIFKINTELLIKLAPLKAPVMHRVKAKVDYFYVPNFQITSVFEKFINPKTNSFSQNILPFSYTTQLANYGKVNNTLIGSLADYLGLPVTQSAWLAAANQAFSVLPFIAYQHIYNNYYRDQNCEVLEGADPTTTSLFLVDSFKDRQGIFGSGQIGANQMKNLFALRKTAWKKDYFTSALPSPQAGNDVVLPLVPSDLMVQSDGASYPQLKDSAGNSLDGEVTIVNGEFDVDGTSGIIDPNNGLYVDKDDFGSISINDFRKLMQLQKFRELAERGGTRYNEMVRSFFGAYLPDYYIDRPIYLGGQVQPIQIGEVVQTSQTTTGESASYQGYRAGIGSSYGKTRTVKFKVPAHGFIIGVLRIIPEATYSQGIERMWTRQSIYDYAFPQFANLGEQEIYNREIFVQGTADDLGVFGYTPRYAEYKEGHCHIAGDFRDSLKYWHFGREFASLPTLSKSFVMMDNPSYNPFYVTNGTVHHVYVDLYNSIHARRELPYFGTPSGL